MPGSLVKRRRGHGRGQRAEVRDQRAEGRGQRTEGRGQRQRAQQHCHSRMLLAGIQKM